jgi:hypothetical protein
MSPSAVRNDDDIDRPVTRDDLEAKLRELKGGVDDTASAASGALVVVGAVVVVGVVAAAFFIGKRRGRKRSTVVEVRRI